MISKLRPWAQLYRRLKHRSLCLDIESIGRWGPITVVGLYRPQESGIIQCEQYVRDRNLTANNLALAFQHCKLLITYNGSVWDIPKIKEEFPGVLPPRLPVVDLFKFSQVFGPRFTSLITWENTYHINDEPRSKQRGAATRLWQQHLRGNQKALEQLLEHNKNDTVNLQFLAEKFINRVLDQSTENVEL